MMKKKSKDYYRVFAPGSARVNEFETSVHGI
jgi:hypothetical protein